MQNGFYLLVLSYSGCSGKDAVKRCLLVSMTKLFSMAFWSLKIWQMLNDFPEGMETPTATFFHAYQAVGQIPKGLPKKIFEQLEQYHIFYRPNGQSTSTKHQRQNFSDCIIHS